MLVALAAAKKQKKREPEAPSLVAVRAFPVRMRSREKLYPFDIERKSSLLAIPPPRDLR